MFYNTRVSDNGMYAMRLYPLGVPMTLQIDDYMPFNTTTNDLAFAQVASDNALWGPLLEKTIAKYVGNYWHLHKGLNPDGIGFFNGSPDYSFEHWKELQELD